MNLLNRSLLPPPHKFNFTMELKFILESILFSAQKPMSARELRDVLNVTASAAGIACRDRSLRAGNTGSLGAIQVFHEFILDWEE